MLDPGAAVFDLLLRARGVATDMPAQGEEHDDDEGLCRIYATLKRLMPTDQEAAHIADAHTHVARYGLAPI